MAGSEIFNKALGNMTGEVAYKAAVRHLCDNGYSAREITQMLTYPVSYEKVQKAIYDYFLDTKVILEHKPSEDICVQKTEYVLDEDSFGKKSYRRVVKSKEEYTKDDYKAVPFGIMSEAQRADLRRYISEKDAEYLFGIPWPKKCVYIKNQGRIKEILSRIDADFLV